MQVVYSQIEGEIVSHLGAINTSGGIDIVQLPQVQAEFERPFKKGRITVAYKSSEFGDVKSTHQIVQDEKVQIELIIQARTLRDEIGLHAITEAVKRRLVGFRPTDCSKMYIVKHGFTDHNNETAIWSYSMIFETIYRVVEDATYNTEPTLQEVLFEYNEELPAIPAVPFPGTFPQPPVIAYKGDIAYWDGEVWRRLHPGEPGYVLATMGQGEVPEWVSPQSGPQGPAGPQGEPGPAGADGAQGPAGADGAQGPAGADGLSAYEVAVANGFVGTEAQWLASLEGPQGPQGPAGADGADGLSSYEVAVANGFVGTEAQWLASLVGPEGPQGPQGPQGEQGPIAVQIRRHDFAGGYSYCGLALLGSLETDPVWIISRIQVTSSGTSTTTYAVNVAWTDRYTATYA